MKHRCAYYIIPVLFLAAMVSCEKFFDVEPKDLLLPDNHFRDKYDADAAVRGIYGKLLYLADKYVILNELRADLMDVTANADHHLRQLNLHEVSGYNPYADPRPFFSLINDCNDVLHNFNIMLDDLKFSREEYNQRYSDIATLRSWLYLQLAVHYGHVPYITEPVDKVENIQAITDGSYPILSIEEMVDTLVKTMESLPYHSLYTDPSFITTIDGYSTRIMFIDKEMFMGDLYLWQGNYLQAASYYKTVMERDIGQNNYDSYKCCYGDVYTLTKFNSGYVRYYYMDENSSLNNWGTMFSVPQSTDYFGEWIWVLYFSENYPPANPFLNYFSRTAGNYLLRPSQVVIDTWDAQVQRNGFVKDFRGEGSSYRMVGGEPQIMKFIADYSPLDPFDRSGQWFLWRTGQLHLRFMEAANQEGKYKLAMALLNAGIRPTYDVPGATDITYLQRTNLPFPFNFDARFSGANQVPLGLRDLWHRNTGLRGRVYLANVEVPEYTDSLTFIKETLISECAMELAFEGHRWSDLVRWSIHENNPAILADRIYAKLQRAGYPEAETVRSKLMVRENWFLPLYADY